MAENRHLERNESWLADESIKDITFLFLAAFPHASLSSSGFFYTAIMANLSTSDSPEC